MDLTAIEAALQDLSKQDTPNISATARAHHVDRSTLSRRFNVVSLSLREKAENQAVLSQQQEKTLILYINKLTERGLPPTPSMVHNFVFDISGKWPGKSWCSRFVRR